jgi:signal transduction histidine kinase
MPTTQRSEARRTTLLELTRSGAIDAGDREAAFREICHAASQALELARVSIWYYDTDREAIVCEELYEREGDKHSSGLTLFRKDFPGYFNYLREERVLAADDAHTDSATAEFSAVYLTPLGINSMLDAPIRFEGKLWGVVCHEHVGPHRTWLTDEQTFGASMADFAARVLSAERQAKAQQELAELNLHLEQLVAERTADLARTVAVLQEAQSQLVESAKLAALGSLVAGVAHEVNTPLGVALTAATAVADQVMQLRSAAQTGQLRKSDLDRFFDKGGQLGDVLLVNLTRAADMVKRFKQVAVRQSTQEQEAFSLAEAMQASVASLEPEWRRAGHTVEVEVREDVRVSAAPGFVFQLVNNLVMNALRHAFEPGRQGTVRFVVERTGPTTAAIGYSDNGLGMTEDVLKRIWEPFFTTKRGAGGSGLGMHIVWNLIVTDLGGSAKAVSAPGGGLQVHFEIPCLAEQG